MATPTEIIMCECTGKDLIWGTSLYISDSHKDKAIALCKEIIKSDDSVHARIAKLTDKRTWLAKHFDYEIFVSSLTRDDANRRGAWISGNLGMDERSYNILHPGVMSILLKLKLGDEI